MISGPHLRASVMLSGNQRMLPSTGETCGNPCSASSSTAAAMHAQKSSCTRYTKSTNSFHVSYSTSGVTSWLTMWMDPKHDGPSPALGSLGSCSHGERAASPIRARAPASTLGP